MNARILQLRILIWLVVLCGIHETAEAQPSTSSAEEMMSVANAAYNQKSFSNAADLYLATFAKYPEQLVAAYNAACSYALMGDTTNAFRWLERISDDGYADVQQLRSDADFESIHTSPHWSQIVTSIRTNDERAKTFWDGPAIATPYQANITEDEKIAGLTKFWEEVKYGFANFSLVPALDWDKRFIEYLPKVRATHSTFEYYRALQQLCAELHDGHTSVFLPWQLDTLLARPTITTRLIEGRVIITDADTDNRRLGIAPGEEIIAIDGTPVKDYVSSHISPFISASTTQDRDARAYETELLSGPLSQPVSLTLMGADGARNIRTIKRATWAKRQQFQSKPAFAWKMLPKNVALVALNTFETPKVSEGFLAAFSEIAKCDAIVFDLRENGGGNDAYAETILGCLTDKPYKKGAYSVRTYSSADRSHGMPEGKRHGAPEGAPNGKLLYTKPVIVLTSPRTYSASEDFIAGFLGMNRGEIVGQPTGGSTGNPLFFKLPGGGQARVCTMHFTLADGSDFVGKGIQPTLLAAPTIAGFRDGKDEVLAVAQHRLGKD